MAAGGSKTAYLTERHEGWVEVSWAEAGRAVDELANGLLALGVRKGDAFGILAPTTLEWALFDYALARIGAIGAAIYANSSPTDAAYILEHSEAVGVLVEDGDQGAKIAALELPHVISFGELDGLRERGRAHAKEHPDALAEAEATVGEEDLFTFIYTSGTTGPPKGCMIRHRNYFEMALACERIAVLRQFEQVHGPRRKLLDWALGVGRRVSELRQAGMPVPAGLRLQHRLADRLVYRKVKEKLGGRLRLGISGGAPLAKEIGQFLHVLDILIVEGWGLTECTTAASVNRPSRFRFGTVGPALPGFEVRTAEDGELLIRSQTVFAGYLKDEAATSEVLGTDGWLRSGDIGSIDEDGFITITDRKKDILVTAGGKNVAPQNLENALKTAPLVSQALVVGDRRPYVAALITLDPATADGLSPEQLEARVQTIVDGVNAPLSRFEQIKRFAVLPRDFTADEGEVTPTLKLKRRVCAEHFAAEIEGLYRG